MLLLLIVAIAVLAGYIPVPPDWMGTAQVVATIVVLYWVAWLIGGIAAVLLHALDKVWRR
jgi:uncharacterized membrane protein YbhN (UPF0104 family)